MTARNEKALQRRISKLEAALTGEGVEGSSSFNGGEGGEGEGEYTPPPCLVYDASERAFVDVSEGAKERYAELDAIARRLGLVGFRALAPMGLLAAAPRDAALKRELDRFIAATSGYGYSLSAPTAAGAAAAAEAEAEEEGGAVHDGLGDASLASWKSYKRSRAAQDAAVGVEYATKAEARATYAYEWRVITGRSTGARRRDASPPPGGDGGSLGTRVLDDDGIPPTTPAPAPAPTMAMASTWPMPGAARGGGAAGAAATAPRAAAAVRPPLPSPRAPASGLTPPLQRRPGRPSPRVAPLDYSAASPLVTTPRPARAGGRGARGGGVGGRR